MWKMIASADRNWGIGKNNGLLVQIPRDMQQFRERTMGAVVIMGRHTLESLPGGLPLQGRECVVLTTKRDYKVKNAVILHSIEQLQAYIGEREQEIYVMGGADIYRQLLPFCDSAYITRIHHVYEADAFFPALDEDEEWELVQESDEQTYFNLEYTFQTYKRRGR